MTKRPIIILFILLLLIPISYLLLKEVKPKKVITIPQLNIVSSPKKSVNSENPTAILSKLKVAVERAKEKTVLSKEEEALEILANLQKHRDELKKLKEEKRVIVKKEIIKKTIPKKSTPKKDREKKPPHKKSQTHKSKPKKVTIKKTSIVKQKPKKKPSIKPMSTRIAKKTTQKQPLSHKKSIRKLSRAEEVALYKKQHQHGLEVIGESQPFILNEVENTQPNSHYFEPITKKESRQSSEPIGFVKTLGVVEVSNQYEVGDVEISKKIELAKEGIVEISSASVETEELKALKFVEPLEVIEVSPAFETIEAKKYIK